MPLSCRREPSAVNLSFCSCLTVLRVSPECKLKDNLQRSTFQLGCEGWSSSSSAAEMSLENRSHVQGLDSSMVHVIACNTRARWLLNLLVCCFWQVKVRFVPSLIHDNVSYTRREQVPSGPTPGPKASPWPDQNPDSGRGRCRPLSSAVSHGLTCRLVFGLL